MSSNMSFNKDGQIKHKVELHVHLDGSIRISTIWDLAKKKGVDLGYSSVEELADALSIKTPTTLADFLKPFDIILPLIAGDEDAIERMAYEFCQDSADQGVLYSEVRYSPHLWMNSPSLNDGPTLDPEQVVRAVNRGLSRGSNDFKIKIRSILACFRGRPEWSESVLDLCLEFQSRGVVGIDIVGDEASCFAHPSDIEVFKRAAASGVHRTVHAGEAGPAANVRTALTEMKAERIGHGYHVVDDAIIFVSCIEDKVHFEVCPYSSCLTGSVTVTGDEHPIVRFAKHKANFSVSRDDPTIIQKTLDEEYSLLKTWGLEDKDLIRANINAVENCFLPEDEKSQLRNQLLEIYGITENDLTAM
ncbi:adenosine deaminase-like [Uloborus diversus]|uniref:adenosine deaminase-like n=1 Tax=Uloborus diversus TaxID=327109 RepID=UPI0024092223|nr:adenosine deaminase-like [Uloborus diversus]